MFKIIKNKKLRIFIIIILILALLSAITVFIFNRLKDNYRSIYKVDDTLRLEQSYYNDFNEIDIDIKMTDLDIKKSLDNSFKVVIYGEEDYIKLEEKNNKLFIKINPKNLIDFDFYSCISKIELYLPTNYSKIIRINNEFGNVEIDEFINSTFDIKQEYGNTLSRGANFIKLDNKYGNVEIEKTIMSRVSVSYGDVKIGTVDDLIVENKFGDITIDSVNKYFKLDNDSGDITINNLVLETDSFITNNYGDIKLGMTNEIYIDAKTDRGKKEIENNYKKSEVTLKIYNKDGDIKVKN